MAETIKKGDAVELCELLEAKQEKDAQGKTFWYAEVPYAKDKKAKPPYTLFEVFLGVYVGMKYVPMNQARRGVVQSAKHGFFFNGIEVFIDPKYVRVAAKIDDATG